MIDGSMMAYRKPTQVPNMLHAVTLIRSGIGRPYWQKRTLEALGLTKMHKTIIHKNTPSVNAMLASVKELIKVQPVAFRTDLQRSPNGSEYMLDNGEIFIDPHDIPHEIIQNQKVRHRKRKGSRHPLEKSNPSGLAN